MIIVINLDKVEKIKIFKDKTQVYFISGKYEQLQDNDAKEFLKSLALRPNFISIGKEEKND